MTTMNSTTRFPVVAVAAAALAAALLGFVVARFTAPSQAPAPAAERPKPDALAISDESLATMGIALETVQTAGNLVDEIHVSAVVAPAPNGQAVVTARAFDLLNAGSSIPARMAMIAITTSSSISVNPARRGLACRQLPVLAFMQPDFLNQPGLVTRGMSVSPTTCWFREATRFSRQSPVPMPGTRRR